MSTLSQDPHSRKRKREQYQDSHKCPRLSFTPQTAEEAAAAVKAAAAKAAAKAEAEAKAAAKAEAEAKAAEEAAVVRISSTESTAQKAASAADVSAAAFAFATASDGNLAWMRNTLPGRAIFSTLPKTEQSLLLQKYTKARAAAALGEDASREPLTHVRTTQTKCRHCFKRIMIGERTNNTYAVWCQKHCRKK